MNLGQGHTAAAAEKIVILVDGHGQIKRHPVVLESIRYMFFLLDYAVYIQFLNHADNGNNLFYLTRIECEKKVSF